METEKIEAIAFGIISQSGDSFSNSMQALQLAKESKFNEAREYLKLADEVLTEAHKTHSQLLFEFAQGEGIKPNILLVHAQDHLTKAEVMVVVIEEFILLNEKIQKLEQGKIAV